MPYEEEVTPLKRLVDWVNEYNQLEEEVKELEKAVDVLLDELFDSSAPVKVMKELMKAKKEELIELANIRLVEVEK